MPSCGQALTAKGIGGWKDPASFAGAAPLSCDSYLQSQLHAGSCRLQARWEGEGLSYGILSPLQLAWTWCVWHCSSFGSMAGRTMPPSFHPHPPPRTHADRVLSSLD